MVVGLVINIIFIFNNINKIDLTYTIPMGVKVHDSSPYVDVSESRGLFVLLTNLGNYVWW